MVLHQIVVITFLRNKIFCFFRQFHTEIQDWSRRFITPFIRISMISKIFSLLSELNITTSSILFRNSGQKVRFNAFSITALLFSSAFCVLACSCKTNTITKIFQLACTNIGGHDDHGILEINFSAQDHQSAVHHPVPATGYYKYPGELFQFHPSKITLIRFAANFFSQLATFFITHISRRCTNQTAYSEFFHVFTHVNPDQ